MATVSDNINKDVSATVRKQNSSKVVSKKSAEKNKATKFVDKAKETLDSVFQPAENVVDELWFGETDAARDKRVAQEAKEGEESTEMIYNILKWGGVGIVVLFGMYILYRAATD